MCNTLTVNELAELLNISPSTIFNMKRNKEIPYHKVRRRILFDKREIEVWWEKTKANSQEIKNENGE